LTAEGLDPAFAEDGVQRVYIGSPTPYNYHDTLYYNNSSTPSLIFYSLEVYVNNLPRAQIGYTADREGTIFGYRISGDPADGPQYIGVFTRNSIIRF
jgi:hypothetical protein